MQSTKKWKRFGVAPHAGARIETFTVAPDLRGGESLPTRERELKPAYRVRRRSGTRSLPTRERELKRFVRRAGNRTSHVAPHAGARIETRLRLMDGQKGVSLPTRERELKLPE